MHKRLILYKVTIFGIPSKLLTKYVLEIKMQLVKLQSVYDMFDMLYGVM